MVNGVEQRTNPATMRALLLIPALLASSVLLSQSDPNFYWKLDESSGAIVHDYMGQSDGLVQGNCTWQPDAGYHFGALRFYGNDARADVGPCDITTGPGDQLTLACWFKPEIVSGTERILMAKTVGNGPNDWLWSLSLVNNTGARFRVNTAGTVNTLEIPPSSIYSNAWYHIAATYDGNSMRLYLNGSTTDAGPASGNIGFHPEAAATLGNLFNNSLPFYGSLDDVRIYDHSLTPSEVVALVITDVFTGITENTITVGPDRQLELPRGSWSELRVMDMSGRLVLSQNITDSGAATALAPMSAGLYLVCLQGRDGALTRPVLLP